MICKSQFLIIQFDYIIPGISGLLAISLIYPTYIYVKYYIKGNLRISKWLFYLGMIFFISIILCYLNHLFVSMVLCHDNALFTILEISMSYLYVIQGVILLAILFQRLVLIFKHRRVSTLAISRCTIRIFCSLFTSVIISASIGTLFYTSSETYNIGVYLLLLAALEYLLMIIWLNSLFIHKICRVYAKNRQDAQLLDMTMKTTILCAVSTIFALLFMTARFLVLYNIGLIGSLQSHLINAFIFFADLHTNYLSVLLSYNHFNKWYLNICGCCHSQCVSCWGCCFHPQNMERRMTEMTHTVSQTGSTRALPSSADPPGILRKVQIEI